MRTEPPTYHAYNGKFMYDERYALSAYNGVDELVIYNQPFANLNQLSGIRHLILWKCDNIEYVGNLQVDRLDIFDCKGVTEVTNIHVNTLLVSACENVTMVHTDPRCRVTIGLCDNIVDITPVNCLQLISCNFPATMKPLRYADNLHIRGCTNIKVLGDLPLVESVIVNNVYGELVNLAQFANARYLTVAGVDDLESIYGFDKINPLHLSLYDIPIRDVTMFAHIKYLTFVRCRYIHTFDALLSEGSRVELVTCVSCGDYNADPRIVINPPNFYNPIDTCDLATPNIPAE